jgi:UDP-sugar transporter A1/2/3
MSAVVAVSSDHIGERKSMHADISSSMNKSLGLLAVVIATFLSGFGSVLSERAVTVLKRPALLFSAELALMGVVFLLVASFFSGELSEIDKAGGIWTAGPGSILGLVPNLSHALGGILVGQVTKRSGSVKKGFAIIAGLLLTAALNSASQNFSLIWLVALPLAGLGIWLHSTPPKAKAKVI